MDTEVFSRLLRLVLDGDVTGAIALLEEIVMQGRELVQFVSDFTWYLRNLLLVKTADGMEDVIDVSTENLLRLKEEAQMAENGVIMRYIRVLSELSGQIRYAAQKRILVEMTLIKLCRPSMETDTQSLLDRIRQLEDKMEKGMAMAAAIPVSAPAGMGAGIPGGEGFQQGGYASAQGTETRAQLPKAVTEDVKAVAGKWSAIVGEAVMPMKAYLKSAFPSLSGEGNLLVVVSDGLPNLLYFLPP